MKEVLFPPRRELGVAELPQQDPARGPSVKGLGFSLLGNFYSQGALGPSRPQGGPKDGGRGQAEGTGGRSPPPGLLRALLAGAPTYGAGAALSQGPR